MITKIGRAFTLKVLQSQTLRKHDGCFIRPSPALRGFHRVRWRQLIAQIADLEKKVSVSRVEDTFRTTFMILTFHNLSLFVGFPRLRACELCALLHMYGSDRF